VTGAIPWRRAATSEDWDALYAEQLPRILNFFRYRVGRAEAEDLAARVFEKAWRHRARYRRDLGAFGTWLLAIARNEAIDHLRRPAHEALEAAGEIAAESDPQRDLEHASNLDRLGRLLETLAARERELIALKYGAGLTNREIARTTGIGESNVGTILHRTIEGLRQAWGTGGAR
jgi:RNA polymerase sigma-70 factor (ECF subfamily)